MLKYRYHVVVLVLALFRAAHAEDSAPPVTNEIPGPQPPPLGPPGFGPGGPMASERKVIKDFDKDGDKRLDKEERAAAREFLKANPRPRGFGPPGGPNPLGGGPRRGPGGPGNEEAVKPGPRVSPNDVAAESITALYAPNTLRTVFLDFESDDWESELEDFHGTDVEVPATLTVDGVKYPGVGVHFRGASSYMGVRAGHKRSFNVSLDHTETKQRLDGYKTLNLLNSHDDETFLSSVLYSHIARQFIPAPKANFVRVVLNGESWGVYVNQQQFNKDFVQENFRTTKGARWKVRGSPGGQGGLDYKGDDIAEYKKHYELKDGDDDDWHALVTLCKTLQETPLEQLEAALQPLLDIDGALWFLALDCALINGDGYWVRASDFSLYRDKAGKFHVIPNDMNEAFRASGGPGFGPRGGRGPGRGPQADGEGDPRPEPGASPRLEAEGGPRPGGRPGFGGPPMGNMPRGQGVKLDPLVGLDDNRKPLRSRLLAVPALQARYLAHVRTIAVDWLDWTKLGPIVAQYRALVGPALAADTRKLSSTEAFERLTADSLPATEDADEPRPRRPGGMPLRAFAEQRRAYLLSVPALTAAP